MRLRAFLAVLIPLGIIIIDQIIKIAIKTQFLLGESYEIASWFQLRFTENRGMAFGMDFIGTGILTVFRLCAPYYAASFGALPAHFVPMGQGYGTFLHGHVVDMFYFPLFQWPDWVPFLGGGTFFGAIFNFADAAISVGAAAMILFYYKYLSLLMNGTPKSVDTSAEKQTEE